MEMESDLESEQGQCICKNNDNVNGNGGRKKDISMETPSSNELILGLSVGGGVLLVIAGALILFCVVKKQKSKQSSDSEIHSFGSSAINGDCVSFHDVEMSNSNRYSSIPSVVQDADASNSMIYDQSTIGENQTDHYVKGGI